MAGHLAQRSADAPAFTLFHQVERIAPQPVEQDGALGLIHRSEHHVDYLREDGIVVEFHAVGGVLADLAGEGPHHRLEEFVDGTYGEAGIVVQHAPQPVGRQGRPRILAVSELVEFLDDARLHLVGRLVGEGDGQDVLVAQRIVGQQQIQVILGQPVGLSTARGGFDKAYWRLHRRLKLQYWQLSSRSVAEKGVAGSRTSATSAASRCSKASSCSGVIE